MMMRDARLLVAVLLLAGCQAGAPSLQDAPDEEGPGPYTQVEAVVNGVSYTVDLGLVYEGRAGDIYISAYNHPELIDAENLARDIAWTACTEAGRIFDQGVPAQQVSKGSWLFDQVCR